MSMVITLAWFAVHAVGGMSGLTAKVQAADLIRHTDTLAFIPSIGWFLPKLSGPDEPQLVGKLVSGRGTWRRIYRPADLLCQKRG
jgi:hypothetical protein